MTELPQSHGTTVTDEELLHGWAHRVFLEMQSIPIGDMVKIIELTTKDLEYYINIVVKATARSDRTHFSFERNSTVGKMPTTALSHATEKFFIKEGSVDMAKLHCSWFKRVLKPPQSSATTRPASVTHTMCVTSPLFGEDSDSLKP